MDTPTDWISSYVIREKANKDVRLCLDPKPLNQALKRNHYPMPTLEDVLPELSNAKLYSVCDVRNGFWHCQLTEDSSYLTTFSTPFGRFRWTVLPFGLNLASDEFQRRLTENIEGLEGVKAVADDILCWGCDEEEHDRRVRALFQRCRERGIKLNRDKLKYKQSEVKYMGHHLTSEGLKADPQKIEAIQNMPPPEDKEGVMRLIGMCNYLQPFAPNLAEITTPIRSLLQKDKEFVWDCPQKEAFELIKKILTTAPVLRYFDPKLHSLTSGFFPKWSGSYTPPERAPGSHGIESTNTY